MKNVSYEAVVEGTKSIDILGTVFVVLFVGIFVFSLYHLNGLSSANRKKPKFEKSLSFVITGAVSLILLFLGSMAILSNMNSNWEDEKAKPYIESLQVKKEEVSNIRIIDESKLKENEYLYTRKTKKNKLPISVAITSGKVDELSGKYQIFKTLKKGEQPYVEYQELEKPIRFYKKGFYNVKVFVPEDYKLDF